MAPVAKDFSNPIADATRPSKTSAEAPPEELAATRLRVLERMLWVWTLLGGAITAVVAIDDVFSDRYQAAAFYVVAYFLIILCLLPRPLPYFLRSTGPLLVLFTVGTHEIYNHGLDSSGNLFYFAMIFFSCALMGARAATGITIIALVTLSVVSYANALNDGVPIEFWDHVHDHCLPDIVAVAVLSAAAITFLTVLLNSLERSMKNSQKYLAEIAHERNHLVRLIAERDSAEQQLRQAQKMEAVGQLAGGIAHDFNNLLQVVSAHTEILLSELDPESTHYTQLGEVQKASERAAALTRQLLAYSRQQIMAPVYLDLNELVENLMNMVHRVIPKNIDTQFCPAPDLGTVYADPVQIEQVLINLCLNARDAMPDGGRLVIETANFQAGDDFVTRHAGTNTRSFVNIKVSDSGVGIKRAELDRIFEPFYTTKSPGEGTGLGLAMAYGIIKQHSGIIHAASRRGVGTVFNLYLPMSDHAALVQETPPATPATGGSETILLAEDDDAVRCLIINVLQNAGFTVLPANNGEQALALFHENHDIVDLLLFDMVMPKMGGREAWDAIQATHPDTRVLFMSGYAPEGLNGRFKIGNGAGFIQKPYRTQQLLDKIREVLDT